MAANWIDSIEWESGYWTAPSGNRIPYTRSMITDLLFGEDNPDVMDYDYELTLWPKNASLTEWEYSGIDEDSFTEHGRTLLKFTRHEFESDPDAILTRIRNAVGRTTNGS